MAQELYLVESFTYDKKAMDEMVGFFPPIALCGIVGIFDEYEKAVAAIREAIKHFNVPEDEYDGGTEFIFPADEDGKFVDISDDEHKEVKWYLKLECIKQNLNEAHY